MRVPRQRPGALLPALLACAACADAPDPAGPPRPHVLLAIADDQDYEHFGFAGHARAHTPTLDRLARSGAHFPIAYVPTSRCRASLAALLSGRWPHQSGVFANRGPQRLAPEHTLPRLLAQAGYDTWLGGKFWEEPLEDYGFAPQRAADEERFVREGQEELLAFVRANDGRTPMFLWWAPKLPHLPHDPEPRHLARVGDAPIDVPAYVRRARHEEYADAERKSLAMVAWLDEGLGELIAVLEETGAWEHTLFAFLIDNGYANGLPSKGSPYEKGLRTPIVLRPPGGAPPDLQGRPFERLASSLDLYPTLLDYAGLAIPAGTVGRSLRPLLEGGSVPERDALCGLVYAKRAEAGDRPADRAVALYARTRTHKYVLFLADRNVAEQPQETAFSATRVLPWTRGDEELFALEADPHERTNLAANEDQRARCDELRARALRWWRESGGGELPLPGG